MLRLSIFVGLWIFAAQAISSEPTSRLFRTEFTASDYGQIPAGWTDQIARRPSRGWIVDSQGFLRPTLKRATGLISYDGYLATAKPARQLADYAVAAEFKKTNDAEESFGLAGRIQDRSNYYVARFVGDGLLQLVVIRDGSETVLSHEATLARYRDRARWRLAFELRGDQLTARLFDEDGRELARVDAVDSQFAKGSPGLVCTPYAAAKSFELTAIEPFEPTYDDAKIAKRNQRLLRDPSYAVVAPLWKFDDCNTRPDQIADQYDVVVAGAGTGGLGAALQAARLGARVLLLEETDWIGGQMATAAVTSMDEDGVYGKYPVRERGVYREFHESMVAYYRSLDKDPFVAYYGHPQQEGGYEPKAVRAVLYGLIAETRNRQLTGGRKPVLDLCLRTRVVAVQKQGQTVVGVSVSHEGLDKSSSKQVACRVLIDATEYGDVIPLTGARYRVSNTTSDAPRPDSPIQDHTWVAVVREYPGGLPDELRIKSPPPDYEEYAAKRFRKFQHHGVQIWGAPAKGIKGPRDWRVYFAWRGMADADTALVGRMSEARHTQCGFNGGNDYPVTAATCDDPAQRRHDERFGIYRTLGALYYFQHELGLNWSVAVDEGFDTPYNRAKMKSLELRPDLAAIAVHLPQQPYVRESRRIIGVKTLRAADLTRYAEAKHVVDSVAMGDYFMDLDHGRTGHLIEADLDSESPPHGGGPFQVPFAAFLPETLDGFLPAEKNLSQSRLANGATRLQPITMLTGQAVGTIAALSVERNLQPRNVPALAVQSVLLDYGSTLIQRWYADVPWGTPLWKATQLLSLHQVLDPPGPIDQDAAVTLGSRATWGTQESISGDQVRAALTKLATLHGISISRFDLPAEGPVSVALLRNTLTAISPAWSQSMDSHAPARSSSGARRRVRTHRGRHSVAIRQTHPLGTSLCG